MFSHYSHFIGEETEKYATTQPKSHVVRWSGVELDGSRA